MRGHIARFGVFEVDLSRAELRREGREVALQRHSFQVLAALVERAGEDVSREELRRLLWPGVEFLDFENGLNSAVARLRQALNDSADNPRLIGTRRGRGYRLLAPVTWIGPTPDGLRGETVAPASPRRRINLIRLGIASLALMTVGATVFELTAFRGGRAVAPPALSSIVVIPFENLSAPESGDYFAEGVTDAVITDLAQFGGLRVISRTSALHYRRTTKTAPQIAGELRVRAILEGSVVRTGSRVRIDAQLIDAAEDRHLWARSYERDVGDILAVQQEVASAVAAQIAPRLWPSGQPGRPSREVNADAYEAYLKGRYYLAGGGGRRQTAETVQTAVTYFQQASRLDPGYAPAFAALAEAYYQFGYAYFVHTLSPAESIRLSEAAAQKAVQIDSSLADAHLALARVRLAQWRWSEGSEEARRAMELDPSDSAAESVYSQYLVSAGRAGEAATLLRRALDRDPFSVELNGSLAWWLFEARDYEGSRRQCRVQMDLNPANPRYRCFALVDEEQGKYADAIERYRHLSELYADPNASANARAELARAYARAGQRAEARRLLNEVGSLDRPDTAYPLALAYAALGDRDTAFRFLEKAFAERSLWLGLVKVEPALDPLRDDPRFNDIVHRMGLDAVH